jgi:serine/threonine protein kinase
MGSHDALAPGSVFAGSFRIVELLADGETGTTCLVDPLPLHPLLEGINRCVLKAMLATLAKYAPLRDTFAAQAKCTSRIASPHVLQTLDAGIDPTTGRPWFTTDLLRGEDLASRVDRWGSQPLSEVRALVAALGDALGKAHAEGIVHYDLTPENIHLGAGEPSRVTLRELTIARLVFDACAADGDIVGTPIWMPPEQFDLGRPLAPAASVWSLGLLAFYAATGKPYWLEATDDAAPSPALLREILVDPIAGALERAAELGCIGALPPWFDGWFARCVARDPGRRFPDATAASASFEEAFHDGPYDLTEDPDDDGVDDDQRTTTRLPPKPARVKGSRRLARSVVGVVAAAPLAVSSAPPPAVSVERAPASAARTRDETRRRAPLAVRTLVVLAAGAGAAALIWFGLRVPRQQGEQRASSAAADSVLAAQSASTQAGPTTSSTPTTPEAMQSLAPSPSGSTEAVASGHETAATEAVAFAVAPDADAAASPASTGAGGFAGKDVPGDSSGFDLAGALKALNGIHYGTCPVPSAGKLAVTFAPSGRVKKVAVLRGNYDPRATRCVAARFGAATVAPFRGGEQTVTADLVRTR